MKTHCPHCAKEGKVNQRFSLARVMIDGISTLVLQCGICDGTADFHELASSDEVLEMDDAD